MVKLVAQREGITLAISPGTDLNEIEVSGNGSQQPMTQTQVGFVQDETRRDITDKVVKEMKTAAFLDSVEKQYSTSDP